MQAAQSPTGSIERFLLVAAFAVSGYSSTAGRTVKPFNPLLGETYELVHAEKGFRAIVEKVCPVLITGLLKPWRVLMSRHSSAAWSSNHWYLGYRQRAE